MFKFVQTKKSNHQVYREYDGIHFFFKKLHLTISEFFVTNYICITIGKIQYLGAAYIEFKYQQFPQPQKN